ncbi:hypothetical protein N658DRAFT_260998 [Parathielavia hyrcaniae]|uniref:Uncharacterized protein n=1 Tax=Parathielavia hyrcaniae TaxID=113614 RepID=A0AAN6SY79_9PEZI|nr:hypothetical protein N658DRAFT_260998 [Parathielavia hyrcaniae]
MVDPQSQPLVLASHAAGHFVIRSATRTLRYLRGFQHSARRSLLAGSLWSPRTSSASDVFLSGAKRPWLSPATAPPCFCSRQDISSRHTVYRHAKRLAPESRARTAAITYGGSLSAPTMTCSNPHSFFPYDPPLKSEGPRSQSDLETQHGTPPWRVKQGPHPTQRAPNLVLLLAPQTLSLLFSVVFSLL